MIVVHDLELQRRRIAVRMAAVHDLEDEPGRTLGDSIDIGVVAVRIECNDTFDTLNTVAVFFGEADAQRELLPGTEVSLIALFVEELHAHLELVARVEVNVIVERIIQCAIVHSEQVAGCEVAHFDDGEIAKVLVIFVRIIGVASRQAQSRYQEKNG